MRKCTWLLLVLSPHGCHSFQHQRWKLWQPRGDNTSNSHIHFRIGQPTSEYLTYLPYFRISTDYSEVWSSLPSSLDSRAAFCNPDRLVQMAWRTRRFSSRALNMTAAARLDVIPQQLRPLVNTDSTSRTASQHDVRTRRPNLTTPAYTRVQRGLGWAALNISINTTEQWLL